MKKINWKSILGWTIATLIAIFIVYTNMQEQKALQNSGKKIVYTVLPLTGPIANSGQEYKKALDLYTQEHPNLPFRFEYIDGQLQPSLSLTALQSKILDVKEPIVLALGATVGSAITPFVEKQGGFTFISGVRSDALNGYQKYLIISAISGKGMKKVADYISKKYERVAIFYSNNDHGVINQRILKENLLPNVNLDSEIFDMANASFKQKTAGHCCFRTCCSSLY